MAGTRSPAPGSEGRAADSDEQVEHGNAPQVAADTLSDHDAAATGSDDWDRDTAPDLGEK